MSPLSLFFFFFLPSVSSSSLFPLLLVICPALPPNIAHLHVLWRPFCLHTSSLQDSTPSERLWAEERGLSLKR
jgi:hypothetical protein